jgi:hypothetical protein
MGPPKEAGPFPIHFYSTVTLFARLRG